MADEIPTLNPDGSVRFASAAALTGVLPALQSGTLVVKGVVKDAAQALQLSLTVEGLDGRLQTRATVVAVLGDRLILRLLDVTVENLAVAFKTAGVSASPAERVAPVPEHAFETARLLLAEAAERMTRFSVAMRNAQSAPTAETISTTTGGQPIMVRTPLATPAVLPPAPAKVLVRPSGHVEFERPSEVTTRVEQITRDATLAAEWTGGVAPPWSSGVFFLHVRGHPAVVDVSAELVPSGAKNVVLMFRDRQALQFALRGLREAVSLHSEPLEGAPQLPAVDTSLCVQFTSVAAVMSVTPMLFGQGSMRVRWTSPERPPTGMVDFSIALSPLTERGVLRGWFGNEHNGLVTLSLDARDDVSFRLNQWLTQVRERTTAKLRAVAAKGPQ